MAKQATHGLALHCLSGTIKPLNFVISRVNYYDDFTAHQSKVGYTSCSGAASTLRQTVCTEWTGRPDRGERGRVSEDRSRD